MLLPENWCEYGGGSKPPPYTMLCSSAHIRALNCHLTYGANCCIIIMYECDFLCNRSNFYIT